MQTLRPMDAGELLDAGFAVYRRQFGLFARIAVLVYAVPGVVTVYLLALIDIEAPPSLAATVGGIIFLAGLWIVAGAIVSAGTMKVLADAYLGYEPSLRGALQTARARLGYVIGANIARGAVYLVPFLGVVIVGTAVAAVTGPGVAAVLVITVAVLAAFACVIVLACGLSVVTQVAVLESLPHAAAALRRAWSLTAGFRSRALLLGVVAFIVVQIPDVIGQILIVVLPAFEPLITPVFFLISLVVAPIVACVFTLYYYDLRVRKEAFDLEILSRQLGIGPEAA